jgi:hypothetical protein
MSETYLDKIREALSTETFYGTPAILSNKNLLQTNLLKYPTLDEDEVIAEALKKHRNNTRLTQVLIQSVMTVGGGLIPGIPALSDKMLSAAEVSKIFSGLGMGFGGGKLVASALDMLNEAQLEELNLSWLKTKQSYKFNYESHRGHAETRLLKIVWNQEMKRHQTMFAIQFPDDHVVHLCPVDKSPIQKHLDKIGYSCDRNIFAISGEYDTCEWVKTKDTIGQYTTDAGLDHTIELWQGSKETVTLVVKYQKPYNFIY